MLSALCRRLAAGTGPASLLGRSLQAEMLSHGGQRAAVRKAPRRPALPLHVLTACLTVCILSASLCVSLVVLV